MALGVGLPGASCASYIGRVASEHEAVGGDVSALVDGAEHSATFAALAATSADVPDALRCFDGLVQASGLVPDLEEYSAKCDAALHGWRSTRYFDTGRYPQARIGAVDQLFGSLAEHLGADISGFAGVGGLRDDAAGVPSGRVLQTVLGLDARDQAGDFRLKYYWVLRSRPGVLIARLLAQLGVEADPNIDLDLVYICGLDFSPRGLVDVKLYFALDRQRVSQVVGNARAVHEVLAGCKLVCFQHCLLSTEKRQMFFHAARSQTLERALIQLGRASASARALTSRIGAMNRVLAGPSLEPWIIAFPFADRRLALQAFNVYFHPSGARPAPSGSRD